MGFDERYLRLELPAAAAGIVNQALDELADRAAVRRLWQHDPTLWKSHGEPPAELTNRLGWLSLPDGFLEPGRLAELERLAADVQRRGLRHVVLCGMGGSSLAPEVFRLTFGSSPGCPELLVLDSTDPGAVRAVDRSIDPGATLFLISSKSGGTIEVLSFLAHFWELAGGRGDQFCAITDPGTSLERLARERGFRQVFLNPPEIGGRYSALSLFGLVPAGLIGIDLQRLLGRAAEERRLCMNEVPTTNPGAYLGAFIGGLARAGRDKLTVLPSPGLASFGLWVEQLIAESTGKAGKGIVPVVGEPIGDPGAYGTDRSFVALRLEGDDTRELDDAVERLRDQQPIVVRALHDRSELGAEMYCWEVATALAGSLLGINPFDQPNVQESKDNTARVLAAHGQVSVPPNLSHPADDSEAIASFLAEAGPGDYIALQGYLTPTSATERRLQAFRAALRDEFQVATTLGFGPRFLHSTGQLHKGGPPTGVFVQLVYEPREDVPIPGQPYSFGTLLAAQALGDLQSLNGRGLRVRRVELGTDVAAGLEALAAAPAAFPRGVS